MAALCAFCTVTAQKPGNTNNAAVPGTPDAGQTTSGGAFVQQQPPQPSPPLLAGGTSGIPSGPSRIVFQAICATDPGAAIAFGGEAGWSAPPAVPVTPKLSALSFAGNATNPASPVCFTNTGTLTVRTLMLAARGDAVDLATLADAPDTARLRLISDGSRQTEPGTVEQSLTRQFLPGCWRVVALDFESPAVLAGITFGGSAGRPEWFRNWRGEVAEIVGFDAPPGADLRAGVANYLALRWGFGGYPAASAQRDAAVAAGLRHYGLVWNLVLFLR